MRYSILLVLGLLGCAPQIIQQFTPNIVEVKSQEKLSSDIKLCRGYAMDYLKGRGSINPSQTLQEGARAGLSDLGYSVISPVAPALGALGGASGEVLSELGLNTADGKKIVTICLHDKGQENNEYHVYDPNN